MAARSTRSDDVVRIGRLGTASATSNACRWGAGSTDRTSENTSSNTSVIADSGSDRSEAAGVALSTRKPALVETREAVTPERRLSDPRVALDDECCRSVGRRGGERRDPRQLPLAPDDRCVDDSHARILIDRSREA